MAAHRQSNAWGNGSAAPDTTATKGRIESAHPGFERNKKGRFRDDLYEGEKSPSPFHPRSSCPGGWGTRRVESGKRLGWSPLPPGKLARNRERMVPKFQKPPREEAEIIRIEGRKFSKSRPPKGPTIFGLQEHHRAWRGANSAVEKKISWKERSQGVGRHCAGGLSSATVGELVWNWLRSAPGRRSARRVQVLARGKD
jgi:hypothetical protein